MKTAKNTADNDSRSAGRKGSAVDANIGMRVRERRIGLGMSLEALGERIGVTYQQVQKYEKGANRIGAGRLQALADALGVGVSHFFDTGPDVPPEPRSADEVKLLAAYRDLDPVLRRRVLELVGSMSRSARDEAA